MPGSLRILVGIVTAVTVLLLAPYWLASRNKVRADKPKFVDVAAQAGLAGFRNVQGGTEAKPHIVEVMGGGAAFLDYNNDGNLDILLVRGSTIENYRNKGGDSVCALYRGDGHGHFVDVTHSAHLDEAKGWGMGVSVADYNNDGWPDIYITGFGRNFLFKNRGDGTFEDVAEQVGVQDGGWGMGAAWGDVNRDGYLDLYAANYLDYPLDHVKPRDASCNFLGFPVFCGPRGLTGQQDKLYIADGHGRFKDVSKEQNIDPNKLYSLTAIMTDYDNDGWPDIFVSTDLAQNLLYHNLGGGKFEETAITAGAAYSEDGVEQGTMGIDSGDFDNDGWPDLYYTNSSFQTDDLLENNHDGSFTNVTGPSGHGQSTYLFVKWGVAFADLDNDGWQDLVIDNGHLYPEADRFHMGLEYRQRPLVFMNNRNKTFRETGLQFGLSQKWKSRGLAVGDYDNDGKLDVLINNLDEGPVLLHNEMTDTGHWLLIRCIGTKSNRSAIGARLTLHAGALQMTREIIAGSSYLSSNDVRVHFGLGQCDRADWLQIRWPSGLVEKIENIKADQILSVEEGKAAPAELQKKKDK